jgi:hypothetical protein
MAVGTSDSALLRHVLLVGLSSRDDLVLVDATLDTGRRKYSDTQDAEIEDKLLELLWHSDAGVAGNAALALSWCASSRASVANALLRRWETLDRRTGDSLAPNLLLAMGSVGGFVRGQDLGMRLAAVIDEARTSDDSVVARVASDAYRMGQRAQVDWAKHRHDRSAAGGRAAEMAAKR